MRYLLSVNLLCIAALISTANAFEPCRINIVEKRSGWPVPLVELRTTHNVRLVSDNAGVVAFDLPELMDVETWLWVEGHGYTVPANGFGYRGVRVTPTEGGELTIEVERQVPAKRLGRISGGGLFAEAQRFGEHADWQDQGILGCDSVQCARHNGKLYWMWGDTTLARFPLGLFHMLGATTGLEPLEEFRPPVRLQFDYVRDASGNPRNVAEMPGPGPTWLSGFISVPDESGKARLVATYVKIRPPLEAYEIGLCVWDEETETFEKYRELWTKTDADDEPVPCPDGHVVRWQDEEGKEWLLFGDPFPRIKCEPTFEAWGNPDAWQVLTPQPRVPTLDGSDEVTHHRGSIAFNEYRDKWIAIFTQFGGESSPLGELWYAEADAPTGPWQSAVKVVTHNNYTFYNPYIHDWTDAESPVVLFEGTYTSAFADHAIPTARHDYNQVLYRLDLDELPLPGNQ